MGLGEGALRDPNGLAGDKVSLVSPMITSFFTFTGKEEKANPSEIKAYINWLSHRT